MDVPMMMGQQQMNIQQQPQPQLQPQMYQQQQMITTPQIASLNIVSQQVYNTMNSDMQTRVQQSLCSVGALASSTFTPTDLPRLIHATTGQKDEFVEMFLDSPPIRAFTFVLSGVSHSTPVRPVLTNGRLILVQDDNTDEWRLLSTPTLQAYNYMDLPAFVSEQVRSNVVTIDNDPTKAILLRQYQHRGLYLPIPLGNIYHVRMQSDDAVLTFGAIWGKTKFQRYAPIALMVVGVPALVVGSLIIRISNDFMTFLFGIACIVFAFACWAVALYYQCCKSVLPPANGQSALRNTQLVIGLIDPLSLQLSQLVLNFDLNDPANTVSSIMAWIAMITRVNPRLQPWNPTSYIGSVNVWNGAPLEPFDATARKRN
eukprot:PhF_6_TR22285/c0_g1_i1/m.31529